MAQKARNADYTKEYNQKAVLRNLRRNAMSRAELARAMGLTRAATSLIVEELLQSGILMELSPQSTGRGRSAIPLAIRPDSYYALGVELARKGCNVCLCDMAGNMLQCRKVTDQENLINPIIIELESLLKMVDRNKVIGIGISSPGPLDTEKGQILNPPRFDRWHGVEVSSMISKALKLPAYLEHDVTALALHQLELGESRNFMLLFVDSGIGAGVISGGKPLGSSKNFTGELGHTTIRFDGRLCECGNRGCLETYASIPRLLDGTEFASWQELIDNMETKPEAKKLLDQEAVYLSAGIINLLNLIPVDTIYLAGDVCYGDDKLAQRLQREIGTRALGRRNQSIRILPADQQPEVGVFSAAGVAITRFLTV